jgi:transposase
MLGGDVMMVLCFVHPKLPNSARELALMYRAKDTIEKDFQMIKSLVNYLCGPFQQDLLA